MLIYKHNISRLYLIKVAKWFMLTMPIIMLFYKDMGFTDAQSFRLKAIYSVAVVIFELPSGYFADMLGRKKTLIIGSLLGTMGFVIYSFSSGYYYFALAEIVLGLGQSFISGSDSALLYDSLKQDGQSFQYTKYEGRLYTLGNYSEAVAGIAGGGLALFSTRYPFIAQSFIAFIAVPASFTLIEPKVTRSIKSPSFKHVIHILKYSLVENVKLRWNLILSALIGTATLSMAWIYQLYLDFLGYSEIFIGGTHTVLNLLVGTTTLFAYKIEQKLKPFNTICLISLVISLSFILLGFVNSWFIFVILALFYVARGVATPVLKDYVNKLCSSDVRATVLSIRNLLIRALFAILGPLFGKASDLYGANTALKLIGLVFVILIGSFILLFVKAKSKKQLNKQ